MPVAEAKGVRDNSDGDVSKYADEKLTTDDAKREQDDSDNQRKGNDGRGKGDGVAQLELLTCDCGPSECPVEERLELSMGFTLDRPVKDAFWEIKFVVDSVNKRHIIPLGATSPRDYPSGESSMHFQVPSISVDGITPCTLANTGLLVAALRSPSVQPRRSNSTEEGKSRENSGGSSGSGAAADCKGDEGRGRGQEIAAVNLVVQVAEAGTGGLMRCIYSPLE